MRRVVVWYIFSLLSSSCLNWEAEVEEERRVESQASAAEPPCAEVEGAEGGAVTEKEKCDILLSGCVILARTCRSLGKAS